MADRICFGCASNHRYPHRAGCMFDQYPQDAPDDALEDDDLDLMGIELHHVNDEFSRGTVARAALTAIRTAAANVAAATAGITGGFQ